MSEKMTMKRYNGHNYPEYQLDADLDREIQAFCISMINSGVWVSDFHVLFLLSVRNAWENFTPFALDDESSCSHLYFGCADYIWGLMPNVYRQHVIENTGFEHFHLVAHNYFDITYPADWFNEHSDLAMSIANVGNSNLSGSHHDVEKEEGHE